MRCTARLQPAFPPLAAQVLDVKPYLRHDIQPDASVPSWCEPVTASSLIREVHFAEGASAALGRCVPRLRLCEIALDPPHPSPSPSPSPNPNPTRARALTRTRARTLPLTRYEDEATVRDVIVQTLLLDIRSVHQGRGEVAAGQQYHVRIDQLDISFETYESHVLVTGCQLRSTWRVDA